MTSTTKCSSATRASPSSTRPCTRCSTASRRCVSQHPEYADSAVIRAALRAGAADHLPGAVGRRRRRGPDQPRLPGRVQLRARPLQGRAAVPPQRQPRHRQVPRLRADLQERPDRHADRRRQGRLRLRPQGPLRRRDHAVLPVVHDRALPPHRRVHRRTGRRHRRGRPRDRLPVRPVQADHQPLRVRRADRQGHVLGRLAGAHARPPATAPSTSSRRCCAAATSPSTASGSWSPGRATWRSTRSRRCTQLGGTVVACSDSSGYVVDEKGIDLDLLKEIKEVDRGRIERVRRASATPRTFSDSGSVWEVACDIALPCATQNELDEDRRHQADQERLHGRRRGRQHARDARGRRACSPRPGCASPRARPPTPAAWRPARWRCSRTPRRDSWDFEQHRGAARRRSCAASTTAACETADEYGQPGQLRRRREHRRLHPGRRRDAGARRHLRASSTNRGSAGEALDVPPPAPVREHRAQATRRHHVEHRLRWVHERAELLAHDARTSSSPSRRGRD